ncbi:MAG: hypothetical protein JXJ20_08455 [Anaerolineae bacterium]|nr:hypothetical protein [Anaerolineae bacterium]
MPLQVLNNALPGLQRSLNQLEAVNDADALWNLLARLLVAHAPTGGANLLGGIGDDIAIIADGLGLRDRVKPYLGSTGNTGIWLGADKQSLDLVVVAHMDRPSFRVRSLDDGTLYSVCANRFPPGEYRASAKAVRFERGKLVVSAAGMLISNKTGDAESLRFEIKQGKLAWHDTVMMDVNPSRTDDTVIGSGLDNSLGVLTALLTAAALRGIEDVLRRQEKRCLFVFTDQEEGLPDGAFGDGAARLAHLFPPPTFGCVVVDAQAAGPGLMPQLGQGVCFGAASKWGSGSVVPPNFHALAIDLADTLNAARANTAQMNHGYLSRSDDMALGRWTRVLALVGPPMTDPHTGYESARLTDVQSAVWGLLYLVAAVMNLAPDLIPRYGLGR